jgi:hypothetical protein
MIMFQGFNISIKIFSNWILKLGKLHYSTLNIRDGKVKVKLSLEQAIKALRGSIDVALLFL